MKKIFTNGIIYTMNKSEPIVQSIVVSGERIVDMGSHEDMILQWGRNDTSIIDMQGKTVIPGLIDSHLHISKVGLNSIELDLTGIQSKDKLLASIKEKAASLQPGEWILGGGWNENIFANKQIPTIEELDNVAPHSPLFLSRICTHAFLVNSRALIQSGYHSGTVIPFGGSVVFKHGTKEPTGLLLEKASTLITKYIPKKSFHQLKSSLKTAMNDAVRFGLTSIHTNDTNYLGGLTHTYQLFDELINDEGIGPRTNLLIDYEYINELVDSKMFAGYGNNKLAIGAIKIFYDGVLGGRTALLSEPYNDAPDRIGDAMFDTETFFNIIKSSREHGMPIAVHTIGDQALTNVLDILDQFPPANYRDRLIHVSVLRKDLLKRLEHSDRIVDIQPKFVISGFPWIVERLGEQRANLTYPFNSLLQSGVMCAGGSDAPIELLNPLLGIHAAVTRRSEGETHNGFNEQEKISMYEAVQLFTLGGAFATNEEREKGTLERGKLCDMTVLSNNLFKMENPDDLFTTTVDMTIIGGDIKYRK